MSDLLRSQIKESCRLALPNGLKELMSDISREVLRGQPPNLYDFITKYLAALLISRENLFIACRLCDDACNPSCQPELVDALKGIGIEDEDATKATNVIEAFFKRGEADEMTLMNELVKFTRIEDDKLVIMQGIIRDAFIQHQINNTDNTVRKVPKEEDDISRAAVHTLELYSKTGPSDKEYHMKVERIQTAYRAYGVRRLCSSKSEKTGKDFRTDYEDEETGIAFDTTDGGVGSLSSGPSSSYSGYDPKNYKENHESASKPSLDEERESSLLSQVNFKESHFFELMSKKLPTMPKQDDEKSVKEKIEVVPIDSGTKLRPGNLEVKISFIPEIHYLDSDYTSKASCYESDVLEVIHEELQYSNYDFELADSEKNREEIVEDQAVDADVESTASVEDNVDENRENQVDLIADDGKIYKEILRRVCEYL